MVILIICVILLLIVRSIEFYSFMMRMSKLCSRYDWKHVERPENANLVVEMLSNKDYYMDREWSAYYFLFLKGPHPIKIFFTLNILEVESIYNKESVEKLKKYEII